MSAKTISVSRSELEALILTGLRAVLPRCDVLSVAVYPLDSGRWVLGHIRLGRSQACPAVVLDRVVRQIKQDYRLRITRNDQ